MPNASWALPPGEVGDRPTELARGWRCPFAYPLVSIVMAKEKRLESVEEKLSLSLVRQN